MAWEKVNDWYMQNGLWTMTYAPNVPLPYGLHRGDTSYGYYKTIEEVKIKHIEFAKSEAVERVEKKSLINQ